MLLPLMAVLLLTGCGSDGAVDTSAEAAETTDSATLRIAVTPTIDCLPLFVAADRGLFDEADVKVRLCAYTAQMDCDTAFERGRVEAMATDLVRAERMQRQGRRLTYITTTALGWQLVTNRTARIRQADQLDDHMVAMTRYSATHLLTKELVDSAGLDADRVFCIQVNDVDVRLQMLLTGVMDALWLPEPQATVARLADHPAIYDTYASGLQFGVLAFSDSALQADTLRRQQMEGLTKAYRAACDSINNNGMHRYRDVIAAHCGVSAEVADSLPDSLKTFFQVAQPRQEDLARVRAWLDRQ